MPRKAETALVSAAPLRGRKLAGRIYSQVSDQLNTLSQVLGRTPQIAVVRIGDDEGALGYERALRRSAKNAGFEFRGEALPGDSAPAVAGARLSQLNQDDAVAGILLLTPVPSHLQAAQLHRLIDPAKDIDGAHPANLGALFAGLPEAMPPATPAAGMVLLDSAPVELEGREALIIGRSLTVGKPLAMLLLQRNCTVTLAHSRTRDLPKVASRADLLCVAIGQAHMVKGTYVKEGAVVLDFGTNYLEEGVAGDCDPEVGEKAGYLTPVPGGIGPLTNAVLMRNASHALQRRVSERT